MGSLAFALGGGLAGAGQGIAAAGNTLLKDQVEQGLMKLRNQYEDERQQKGFTHQEQLLEKEHGYNVQAATAAAGLKREEMKQKEDIAARHETESTKRTGMIVAGREKVASTNKEARENAGKGPKPWQVKNVNVYATKPDGTPDYAAPPAQKPLLFNPNNTALYAPMGDKLVRWDSSRNAPAVDPKVFARSPIDPGELARLHQDPNGVIPAGYKGAGLTNAENFERIHHWLPSTIGSRLMQGGMVNEKSPGATGEVGGPSESEEAQDQSVAEGGAGYDTSYANTGDEGPQASDNAPAQ